MAHVSEHISEVDELERREQVRVTDEGGRERREEIVEDIGRERRQMLYKITSIIWLVTGAIEGLIGLRIMLKFIAANPNNPFAIFIYALSSLFVGAFLGLTATPNLNGVVLEISSLIAMVVYVLIAWFIVQTIWILFERTSSRRVSLYERNKRSDDGSTMKDAAS